MNEPIPPWIEAIIDAIRFAIVATLVILFFPDWRYIPIAAVAWGIGSYMALWLKRNYEVVDDD